MKLTVKFKSFRVNTDLQWNKIFVPYICQFHTQDQVFANWKTLEEDFLSFLRLFKLSKIFQLLFFWGFTMPKMMEYWWPGNSLLIRLPIWNLHLTLSAWAAKIISGECSWLVTPRYTCRYCNIFLFIFYDKTSFFNWLFQLSPFLICLHSCLSMKSSVLSLVFKLQKICS